ncbi:hypothetical protein EYZ11_009059 [Aspergillus tanneri]|uniref:Uncharacterized protein n=1 Tax=Aspergillus tanneri TaxID=1220188 RepID=A0A4S3J8Y7_9EURO|nr:hypothetical protein EYZ11_009059 [Aspergillus tanneri]
MSVTDTTLPGDSAQKYFGGNWIQITLTRSPGSK